MASMLGYFPLPMFPLIRSRYDRTIGMDAQGTSAFVERVVHVFTETPRWVYEAFSWLWQQS